MNVPPFNEFTIDNEKRLAYRTEIKKSLAEIAVKKHRIVDLQNIVAKLDRDSDDAADSHSQSASVLQSELDKLDAEHIKAVMADKELPEVSLAKRRAILDELTELNQSLESRCEANRRSAAPIKKQISELASEVSSESTLRNHLRRLCSPELRRRRFANDLRLKFANAAVGECQRLISIYKANYESCSEGSRERAAIFKTQKTDHEEILAELLRDVAKLQTQTNKTLDECMAE